ncbi:MAG: hypothetical protein Q9196_004188 [Gyalolechia fulgens]
MDCIAKGVKKPAQFTEYFLTRHHTSARMPGLSYDIDKLLREIQGPVRHQDVADQLRPVSNATATSTSNYTAVPPSVNPQYAIASRASSNLHQLRHPATNVEDYEAPLDPFGDHLLLPRHTHELISIQQIKHCLTNPKKLRVNSTISADGGSPKLYRDICVGLTS